MDKYIIIEYISFFVTALGFAISIFCFFKFKEKKKKHKQYKLKLDLDTDTIFNCKIEMARERTSNHILASSDKDLYKKIEIGSNLLDKYMVDNDCTIGDICHRVY